ncbi:hypothetical protein SAMN04488027_10293 [Psychroflexus sediminis]|uniref:Dolichyl-phosphate-mannose-protein mannosyltransferase n=1 Tax=Psychroflexus sediminis TaxID=470826 RepID=A0A1G7UKD3_9FLAO|nr:hypothetical protein SAMN04488027_10293 [Psychroflexus sediminis]
MLIRSFFIKRSISLFILLVVNFIFSYKYLERIVDFPLLLSVVLSSIYFLILYFPQRFLQNFKESQIKNINILILICFSLICIYVFSKIQVESLNVDRWSVITNFWDAFFRGEYVYLSTSNVGNPPGPMPFYFIIAFPFYLLGELGFMSLTGLFAFYILCLYQKINPYKIFICLIFICLSAFYLWEVVSRSNVLLNSTLILLSIVFFENFKKFNYFKIIISSLIVGLLLSTRNVFAIAYIIYFMYLLLSKKISFLKLVLLTIFSILFFSLTFLPFVYNHFDDFFVMNPFIVQSSFLIPFEYTIMFLIIAFLSSLIAKSFQDSIFYIGINLFISIFIYSVYLIINSGFVEAYEGSVIDISYFIFCVPFLLYTILISPEKSKTQTKYNFTG